MIYWSDKTNRLEYSSKPLMKKIYSTCQTHTHTHKKKTRCAFFNLLQSHLTHLPVCKVAYPLALKYKLER